jgi:hypothetical protein
MNNKNKGDIKMKKYIAIIDNGRDYCEMAFNSDYRANSKGNTDDALSTYRRAYGRNFFNKGVSVSDVRLAKDYE